MMRSAIQGFARNERAPDDYLYLLLDPLAPCPPTEPLSIHSLTQALGEAAIARVMRPDLAHTPDACPALVQLAAPGDTANDSLLASAERHASEDAIYKKRYVCGWLTSDRPITALADHLAARCLDVITPVAGRRMTPWFEPLRLELLAASMERAFPALLWPVKRWLCPTSWGTYTLLRGAPSETGMDAPVLARHAQQLAPLVGDFLDVWRLALKLPMTYAPMRWRGATILPPQAAVHAFRMIRDAHKLGLRLSADIIDLCTHRVFIHPSLPRHPNVQDDIAAAAAGQSTLQARFETYDDLMWKRIVASLPPAANYT
ncbi:hypothetical protein [Achromobacter spanius]|uniref:hypothetical protein n=1 Tax=Achromobacter spanius TaxID=217203 RepID=UPI0038216341